MKYRKKIEKSLNEKVHESFTILCKKCGSDDVVMRYEKEGGYSAYTKWGSHFAMGCNFCSNNDIYE